MSDGNPLKILDRRGIRTDRGWMTATQEFIDLTKEYWTERQYTEFVSEMMSIDVTFENQEIARFTATYLVQEFMRVHWDDPAALIDLDAVYALAQKRAAEYIHRMDHGDLKYMRAAPDTDDGFDENAPPVVDDRGNRKRKKGAKKEMAAELYQSERLNLTRAEMIARFMDEIGMSKAGATTYFHNNKAAYGPCKEA